MRCYSINNISVEKLPTLDLNVLKPKVEPLTDQVEVVNDKVLSHISSKAEIKKRVNLVFDRPMKMLQFGQVKKDIRRIGKGHESYE